MDSQRCYKVKRLENSLKVHPEHAGLTPSAFSPVRGAITGFSPFAATRLRGLIRSMELKRYFKTFITLTFEGMPDVQVAKSQLNVFLTRLRREYPGVLYLWVQEFQVRGAVHFHMCCSIDKDKLPHQFKRIIGDDGRYMTTRLIKPSWWPHGLTSIGEIDYADGLEYYLGKELQKRNQKRVVCYAGRWWGASRNLVERGLWVVDKSYVDEMALHGRGDVNRIWYGDLRDFKTLERFKHICQNNDECSKEYAEKQKAVRCSRGETLLQMRERIRGLDKCPF